MTGRRLKKRHILGIMLIFIFFIWVMFGAILAHPQWNQRVYLFRQLINGVPHNIDIPAPKNYTGKWVQWYPLGWGGAIKRELHYKNGILNGEVELYRRDETKLADKTYIYGKLDGKITFYHTDGRMRWTGCIAHDALDGRFRFWDKNGRLIADGIYQINKEYTGIFHPTNLGPCTIADMASLFGDELEFMWSTKRDEYNISSIGNIFDENAVVYYLKGKKVSKEAYIVAAKRDSSLPDLEGALAATPKSESTYNSTTAVQPGRPR